MSKKGQILQKIKTVVGRNAPNAELYLYGSRARGNSDKLSDWDLLILLNSSDISFDFELKIMDELYDIELETGEIISPLIYSKNDWNSHYSITPFYENVKNEGVRIK
ncbi:Predicted nucleotidyltransferase [Tangfeifania diversioriginum]|uniref:Predicted nucleotidyltransferase n=1 Tax=Tangfeifania diversioriginum TaxID=1168035 RepID=A0A1M6B4I3_9BACT|nr:nucleotidyltransferase domain-containing protein [Tangfeifania diversioriginum]SHI43659.1 Predicted nucleotidyltransferase [Tangfeifania diversioriginum]